MKCPLFKVQTQEGDCSWLYTEWNPLQAHLQHHPELKLGMGGPTSLPHRKPIHDAWQWRTTSTGWAFRFRKGKVSSIYIDSSTTPSDSWIPTTILDDITVLENVQRKVHSVHSELLPAHQTGM